MTTEAESTTVTLRVWDAGCSETWELDREDGDDYEAIAREMWGEPDYGEGEDCDWCVTIHWRAVDADGDILDEGSFNMEGHRAEPACPEADEHEWSSEHCGGCSENPGVWSTGGTSMVFVSRCRHCGMRREERVMGSQRNPGECDTTTYGDPDPAWVGEHYGHE